MEVCPLPCYGAVTLVLCTGVWDHRPWLHVRRVSGSCLSFCSFPPQSGVQDWGRTGCGSLQLPRISPHLAGSHWGQHGGYHCQPLVHFRFCSFVSLAYCLFCFVFSLYYIMRSTVIYTEHLVFILKSRRLQGLNVLCKNTYRILAWWPLGKPLQPIILVFERRLEDSSWTLAQSVWLQHLNLIPQYLKPWVSQSYQGSVTLTFHL